MDLLWTFFSVFSDGNADAEGGESQMDESQADAGVEAEDGKRAAEGDGDWELPYSDEEMEDPQKWMPPPVEIKRLYELLAKGEMLELNFVPLLRRPPTPERTPSPERDEEEEAAKERERMDRERKSVLLFLSVISHLRISVCALLVVNTQFFSFRPPSPTEFDFDEEQMQSTPKNAFLSRRRTPGMQQSLICVIFFLTSSSLRCLRKNK